VNRVEWSKLKYADPSKFLLDADTLFITSGLKRFKNSTDILLDKRLRPLYEDWRCAVFCHGAGQALGAKILFARLESADYDYVGAFEHPDGLARFPIQMKQLVPERLNDATNLQIEIDKLKKYTDAKDLVVAIHVNRKVNLRPEKLNVSGLRVKEIWLFGQLQPNTWLLTGNLMGNPSSYKFRFPVANSLKRTAAE
jgi:hypothetical protein